MIKTTMSCAFFQNESSLAKNLGILYTTVETQTQAQKMATLAVSKRLAVCVNMIPGGKSVYMWNGNIEKSDECYMLFKTLPTLLPELKQWVLEQHPYEVPAIFTFQGETSPAFFDDVMHFFSPQPIG